jgi:hypothetical protein
MTGITAGKFIRGAASDFAFARTMYLRWSGRRDSNPRPSAPKAGKSICGVLLKSRENNCSELNGLARPKLTLLNLVALGCFDSYKIIDTRRFRFPSRSSNRSEPIQMVFRIGRI